MSITSIFEDYLNNIAQILWYQRAIKSTADNEIINLRKLEQQEPADASVSFDKFQFLLAQTGDSRIFGRTKKSVKDRKDAVRLHQNSQYRWLLVECYEVFEDFVAEVYIYALKKGKVDWISDIYKFPEGECITSKIYSEKIAMSGKAHGLILKKFRKTFKPFSEIERKNKLGINLELAISLIEKLRHIIVHKKGVISNKQIFINNLSKETGLSKNQEFLCFINQFLDVYQESEIISLLERPRIDCPIGIYDDMFTLPVNWLLAYSELIHQHLLSLEE
jgi:hypothetical protein